MKTFSAHHHTLFCLVLPTLLIFEGCTGLRSLQESQDLEIAFVAFSQDGQGYGTFAIHNTANMPLKIEAIKIIDRNSSEEFPSSLLKLTSRKILPEAWEYGVFQNGKRTAHSRSAIRVEYERNGKYYFSQREIAKKAVRISSIYPNEDLSALFMSMTVDGPLGAETMEHCQVRVNGEKASITNFSVLLTKDDRIFLCMKIEPPRMLNHGDRLFISAAWDDQTIYGGCMEAFYPFVVGPAQYGKVMRPVDIEFGKDSVTLNIYNEADFRKCPAVIEKVFLDGKDVTTQCVFSNGPFPPDLHNYDVDIRPVIVKNVSLDRGKKYRFDVDFKRLEPLRPSPVTEGYFDLQRFSFDVQRDVPYEIDTENGLPGGSCVLYAGLRPRPETAELIRRYDSVVSVDPSIPVYLCPHEGTQPETVFQLAASSDFILPGQLNPLIPATFGKSQKFFDHVRYMRELPVPWACSVISDNDHQTDAQDLEWLAWGAIGAGSHGVFLSAHEKGDIETIAECRKGVEAIFRQIKTLSPLFGLSVPVDLEYDLNQFGLHVDFLACGTDHILAVILNEWSTRCCFQESEPFMAAMRKDARLTLSLGSGWHVAEVIDPIQKRSLAHVDDGQGNLEIKLPCFDNVQTVLLSREKKWLGEKIGDDSVVSSPVVFLDNPIVSLGVLRPGAERIVEIPIRSHVEKMLLLTGNAVSDLNSKPGEVQAEGSTLEAKTQGTIRIKYKAPMSTGKSVTHVRYASPDLPGEIFPIYLCAEVENPAELSQSMVDFGYVPIGEASKPKTVSLKSSDTTAKITKVASDGNTVQNIRITDDGKSFSFSTTPQKIGPFSEEIAVKIAINQVRETITQTVRCSGHAQAVVFALPPQISLVMGAQAKKHTVGIRHIEDKPIRISSVTFGKAVQCRFDSDDWKQSQAIELTISPEILQTKEETLVVKGTAEGGKNFSLSIPVNAFPQQTPNSSQME